MQHRHSIPYAWPTQRPQRPTIQAPHVPHVSMSHAKHISISLFRITPPAQCFLTMVGQADLPCAPTPAAPQDGIVAEWEEQLPLREYAIRMPTRFVHRMPEFLEEYESLGRLAHAQKVMHCVWRLHMWQRLLGGKVRLDTDSCRLFCGDSTAVDFNNEHTV
jgi:hypothetical protein